MGLVVPYLWIRNFNPCTSKIIIMCLVSANLIVCWLFCGFFCTITFLWFGFYYRDILYFVFVEMWFDPLSSSYKYALPVSFSLSSLYFIIVASRCGPAVTISCRMNLMTINSTFLLALESHCFCLYLNHT